jgi:hypothetical protein
VKLLTRRCGSMQRHDRSASAPPFEGLEPNKHNYVCANRRKTKMGFLRDVPTRGKQKASVAS